MVILVNKSIGVIRFRRYNLKYICIYIILLFISAKSQKCRVINEFE